MIDTKPITLGNFWKHTYPKTLNIKGRLALLTFVYFTDQGLPMIDEDMSLFSGLETGELQSYRRLFVSEGVL